MAVKTNFTKEKLVATIKDIGQEIIDRAEEMVDDDVEFVTNFQITAEIEPHEAPVLQWSNSTIIKNFMKREGGGSTGTATIAYKTDCVCTEPKKVVGEWAYNYDPMGNVTHIKCSICGNVDSYPYRISESLPNLCRHCHNEMDPSIH